MTDPIYKEPVRYNEIINDIGSHPLPIRLLGENHSFVKSRRCHIDLSDG